MPSIYVINLDRDTDRMASLTANLKSLELDFIRVPAILGRDMPQWENLVNANLYASRNRNPLPRLGEVGCYLSHLKAMELFLKSDNEWCVILEDDVEVLPTSLPVLSALCKCDDWDLVKLFCFHSGMPISKRALSPTHRLVVHLTRTTSSAAYAINRKAAERLLISMKPITEQVDHALDRPWETGLRIRGVRPLPIILAPIASITTIGYADRNKNRLPPSRAFKLLFSRATKEVRRFLNGLAEAFLR